MSSEVIQSQIQQTVNESIPLVSREIHERHSKSLLRCDKRRLDCNDDRKRGHRQVF